MPQDQTRPALSRRRFVQRSAVGAGATVATVGAGSAVVSAAVDSPIPSGSDLAARTLVAATVVRASHSKEAPGTLALGVRASVLSPDGTRDGLVVVVEPIDFGLPTAQINTQIADAVRAKAADLLSRRDRTISTEDIVVQVFGGAL